MRVMILAAAAFLGVPFLPAQTPQAVGAQAPRSPSAAARAAWTAFDLAAIERTAGSLKDRYAGTGIQTLIDEIVRMRTGDPTALNPRELQPRFELALLMVKADAGAGPASDTVVGKASRLDPAVRLLFYEYAQGERFAEIWFEPAARAVLEAAEKGVAPHLVAGAAGWVIMSESQDPRYGKLRQEVRAVAIAQWISALSAPGMTPEIERYVARLFHRQVQRGLPLELADAVLEGLEARRSASPWVWAYLRSVVELAQGWKKRGTGFGRDVTPNAARAFAEHVNRATAAAEEAWSLDPTRVEPALVLVEAGRAGDKDTKARYERGVAVCRDYLPLHEMYLSGLSPQWGGSVRQMTDFVTHVIADAAPEDDTALFGVRGLAIIGGMTDQFGALDHAAPVWPAANKALAQAAESPAWSSRRGYLDSARALLAWRANQGEALAEIVLAPRFELVRTPVDLLRLSPEDMQRDAVWFHPGVPVAIAKAGRSGDGPAAAAAFKAAEASLPRDLVQRLRWAVRDLELASGVSSAASGGEWYEVPFEPGLPGWRSRLAPFDHAKAQREVLRPPGSGESVLWLAGGLGERWEMSFQVGWMANSPKASSEFVGIALSPSRDWFRESCFATSFNRQQAWIGNADSRKLPVVRGTGRTFSIAVWDGRMTVVCDEELVFAGPVPYPNFSGEHAGVRFLLPDIGLPTNAVSAVRVRGLVKPPAALKIEEDPRNGRPAGLRDDARPKRDGGGA